MRAVQPRQRPFHHPAVPAQPLAGVDAFTRDPALDAALAQVPAAVTRIVGLIGVDFFGPSPRAAQAAADGWDGLQQGLEHRAIMVIRGREFDRQRDALAVDDHVALGARFAPVGRVGPREQAAPFGRHAAAVQAGPAPIEFIKLAQPVKQLVMDALPDALGLPLLEPSPAGHARAVTQGLRQQFPGDAAAQHKENTRQDFSSGQARPTTARPQRIRRQQQLQHRPQPVLQNRFRHPPTCHPGRAASEVLLGALSSALSIF